MFKSMVVAAGALAIISTAAFAQSDASSTTRITRTAPDGASSSTVIHRHVNGEGDVVTKKRTETEGSGGSTVTTRRTMTDPANGASTTTVTRQTTEH
ncbi:MAG: hypothetical protein JO001_04795 [Alphaproteobacteria bacterium]|nr:hypothetical protein [Alphaproteobacteria bacterium]